MPDFYGLNSICYYLMSCFLELLPSPDRHAISSTEKELLARGKYDELLRHQENLNRQQDDMVRV